MSEAAANPAPGIHDEEDSTVVTGRAGGDYLIADLAIHERPRERLLEKGVDHLRDDELLAIIVKTGPAGRSALGVAQDLLQRFGHNLRDLAAAPPSELLSIHGIGPAKAAELKATFELAARMAAELRRQRPKISEPGQAADYFRERLRGKKQEELHALLLDTKNRVVREELITVGLLDQSQAHPREVFRPAIQHSAARIILAHNHPSGDPTPSSKDISCTRELAAAGTIIGINIADHIIMGEPGIERKEDYFSFRENGLLS